ncbi:MAG TPA: ABC transporter permease [Crinalium sp.]|jgi:putative ABC transport system permease protein
MTIALLDLLNLTCRSLLNNPLRSALTTLGVFMGVTAVSATLQVGNISQAVIDRRLAERDAPQVTVFPEWIPGPQESIQLQLPDMEFLRQRLKGLESISAFNWAGSRQVLFQDQEAYPAIGAVTQDFLRTAGRKLIQGRFFSEADFANYRPVVVIDQILMRQLFKAQNPLGQRIYVNGQPYVIVGIMPSRLEEDDPTRGQLLLPMSLYSALTGSREIGSIQMRPYQLDDLDTLEEQAKTLLAQRFPGQQFYAWNNVEDILEQRQVLQLTSRALAAVGAIALLVGGVGIANIMIAAVTERTAEIGLRRAIGATQPEIMLQFMLEAGLLSLLGGAIAIGTVHGLTLIVSDVFELPYQFEASTAIFSLTSAMGVGVGASFLPALRASRLDPVKALRSE